PTGQAITRNVEQGIKGASSLSPIVIAYNDDVGGDATAATRGPVIERSVDCAAGMDRRARWRSVLTTGDTLLDRVGTEARRRRRRGRVQRKVNSGGLRGAEIVVADVHAVIAGTGSAGNDG